MDGISHRGVLWAKINISRGVTQVYPLYPIIFKVAVDAVVQH